MAHLAPDLRGLVSLKQAARRTTGLEGIPNLLTVFEFRGIMYLSYRAALRSNESPYRALAMLNNFARGHALIHGRQQLTEADLPRTAQLALGSIPEHKRRVFTALIRTGGIMSVAVGEEALGWTYPTVKEKMEACHGEVLQFLTDPVSHLRLREDWAWCMLLQGLLGGPLEVDVRSPLMEAYRKRALKKAKEAGQEHLVPAEWRDGSKKA